MWVLIVCECTHPRSEDGALLVYVLHGTDISWYAVRTYQYLVHSITAAYLVRVDTVEAYSSARTAVLVVAFSCFSLVMRYFHMWEGRRLSVHHPCSAVDTTTTQRHGHGGNAPPVDALLHVSCRSLDEVLADRPP